MDNQTLIFLQHIDALRSNDPATVHASDLALQELTLLPSAIQSLVSIIQSDLDVHFRLYATVFLNRAFRGLINDNADHSELIHALLTILSQESVNLIRKNLGYFIGKCLINANTINLALGFAKAALESQNVQQIYSAVQLLSYVIGIFEPNPDLVQFIDRLVLAAISFKDPEITIDSLQFGFDFHNKHSPIVDEATQKFWEIAVSLLESFFNSPSHFWNISAIIGDIIDFGAPYADSIGLLPQCLQMINRDPIEPDVQAGLVYIIDSICSEIPDAVLGMNLAIPIFQRYVQLAMQAYSPNETIDNFDATIMSNIFINFSEDESFITTVWNAIPNLGQDDRGRYLAMIILKYAWEKNSDFFFDYFDDVVNLIADAIQSQSIATSEAGLLCLESFVNQYRDEVQDYLSLFEELLINIIKNKPLLGYLSTLEIVMRYSESTDNIFNEVFAIVMEFMQKTSSETHPTLIQILTTLTKGSEICVMEHFQTLLNCLQTFLSSNSPESQYLKSDVVDCMTNLMRSAPEQFKPYLGPFLEFINSSFGSDDPSFLCSCINAYGALFLEYPSELHSSTLQILPIMASFALQDKSAQIKQVAALAEQNCTPDEIDDDGMADIINADALNVAGVAFLVFASILSKTPMLIPEFIRQASELIKLLTSSSLEYSIDSACKGLNFIIEAIVAANYQNNEIFESFFICMKIAIQNALSTQIIGDALETIAALVHAFGINNLGEAAKQIPNDIVDILECNHPILVEEKKLPQDLYQSISIIFFAMFDKFSPEEVSQVMEITQPAILKYAQSNNKKEKALALEILLNYAEHSNNLTQDFTLSLYSLAFQCATNDLMQGFYAINKLTIIAPDLIRANAGPLVQLFGQKLSQKKRKSYDNQLMIDNCVAALGSFAMNIMNDDFPVKQFAPLALSNMPPSVDFSVAFEQINFLLWMIPKAQEFMQDFLKFFAKFFSLSSSIIQKMEIPAESYQTLKAIFAKLLTIVPNSQQLCAQTLHNDPAKLQLLQQVLSG